MGGESENWHQIEALFDAALEIPPEERVDFVQDAAQDEPLIAKRVLQLLDAEQRSDDFLEATAPQTAQNFELSGETRQHQRIGPWAIRKLLGRGGMASVYLAERVDGQFEQQAASKLISDNKAELLERFQTERQILANLQHPGIAALLDGGLTEDGHPYMAMEYVDGQSLSDYCRGPAKLRQRIQVFLQICAAVSYAHRHLIVHRDIKPDNIIIDADGRPRLLDFGIAKLIDPSIDGDNTQALATPNYAAPEQLTGDAITTATDVYGLGAILYFMLCGHPPLDLRKCSLPDLIDKLLNEIPPLASERCADAAIAKSLRGDLDAICACALSKDRSQRYESVSALAQDLRQHLDGHAISARAPTWSYRASRWLRRNALAAGATVAIMLSLVVGMSATAWQAHKAGLERDMARRDADRLSQMRSSILQLFRTAASQLDSDQLTVRELFQQSANTIEQDFADDPATAGALLQMLGELNLFTEDYAAAKRLLDLALSYEDQGLAPDILAAVNNDLAHLAYREGDFPKAKRLHELALDHWTKQAGRYRAELLAAATLSSQLARAAGDTDAAVVILRQTAEEARRYWGPHHSETGVVLINLSVAHYYNNDIPAAIAACEDAWEVWQAIDRTESPDALNLLANWGLFALRYGQLIEGEKRLAAALELRTKLYGASAAQATLMKSLGVAHRLNGRDLEGMALLEQAEWMAAKYAGVGGRLHASATYALAWALKQDQQFAEAEARIRALLATAGEHHSLWHSLNRALLASLPGIQRAESEATFSQALLELSDYGPAARHQHAEALALYAQWQAQQEHFEIAIPAMQEAIEKLSLARHNKHFRVLQLRSVLADWLPQSQSALALKMKQESYSQAVDQLGENHPLTVSLSQRL